LAEELEPLGPSQWRLRIETIPVRNRKAMASFATRVHD
jgi:hypothetical protein